MFRQGVYVYVWLQRHIGCDIEKEKNFLQKLALSNSFVWTVCQEFVSMDLSNIVWQQGQSV